MTEEPLDISIERLLRELRPQALGTVVRKFRDFAAAADAVRAHLLELAGDRQGAIGHYRAAAAKTGSLPERDYLLTQAARLSIEL